MRGWALKPNLMTINITSRCNLRCAMCMQPRGEASGDDDSPFLRAGKAELTTEQWIEVIDQAKSARPAFYFSGGEPLLYRGIDDLLAHIKSQGLIAALVTNGTLLEKHAEKLVEIGVDNVTISLDGPEDLHDNIRGVAGTFQRARRGIEALFAARKEKGVAYPKVKVNCVILPLNITRLLEVYKVASQMGIEEINLQHPMFDSAKNVQRHNRIMARTFGKDFEETASKGEGEFYESRLSEADFQQLEMALDAIMRQPSPLPRVTFFPEVKRADWRGYYLDMDYPFSQRCRAIWTNMRLLADGSFEPCLHYHVGNVTEQPLWELWNDPKARRFRRQLAKGLFPACARCCYRCY